MNLTIAPTSVAPPMATPQLPKRATETQIAKAYMTPQTAAVLKDHLLDARIGTGTVAGGLNDTIRFRVSGVGAARTFVPDSKLAVEILRSPAGARLVQQLEHAAQSADWMAGKSNLTGFALAEDTQAVAAMSIIADLEPGGAPLKSPKEPTPRTPHTTRKLMKDEYAYTAEGVKSAGAWNSRGWITFMPDTSRMMLTSVSAYKPKEHADNRIGFPRRANYVNETLTHEVQHSITSRKGRYEDVRWMEEGIANIFSQTPTFRRATERATGVTPRTFNNETRRKATLDTGWEKWTRPKLAGPKAGDVRTEQTKRYVSSQPILRGLLRMAGAGLDSNAGKDKARALLQGTELNRVPGNLANAIIDRNGLDRDKVYEDLRLAIRSSIDDAHSLQKIAKRFGVKGP